MTAPSAVLLILVVLSSCEVIVGDTLSAGNVTLPVEVVVEVSVNGDALSIVMMVEVMVCDDEVSTNVLDYTSVTLTGGRSFCDCIQDSSNCPIVYSNCIQTTFTCFLTHDLSNCIVKTWFSKSTWL